ncbi:MAG: class I SAM-dependent methyltransferase [Leptospirales bacterium]
MIKQYLRGKIYHLVLEAVQDALHDQEKMDSTRINLELQKKALSETASYVTEHLDKAAAFSDRFELINFALEQTTTSGLFLEFGVFQGESINYIARKIAPDTIYGFDSFEGLPEFWRNGFGPGTFVTEGIPQVEKNVILVPGWFHETVPRFLTTNHDFVAFLHVDCDLYSSTKTILHHLIHYIRSGTVIVFDEYFNYPSWREGEFRAFGEFVSSTGLKYEYLGYNQRSEQVAVVIK